MCIAVIQQPAMKTRLKALMLADRDDAEDEKNDKVAAAADIDVSCWEPLSMQALLDYKKHFAAPGQGEFALGQVRLWPVTR